MQLVTNLVVIMQVITDLVVLMQVITVRRTADVVESEPLSAHVRVVGPTSAAI